MPRALAAASAGHHDATLSSNELHRTVTEPLLGDLYERYRRRIQTVCLAYLHEATAAEDAVQEVFLRAGPRLHARRGENLAGYLDGVARNVCREELRRRRGITVTGEMRGATDQGVEPESVALDRRVIDGVWEQLSLRDRLLVFHRFAGYSQAEIGARLHLSTKAVEMGLWRARQKARRLLDGLPAVLGLLRRRGAAVRRRRAATRLGLRAQFPALLPTAVVATTVLLAVSLRLQLTGAPPSAAVLAHVSPAPAGTVAQVPDVDLQNLSGPAGMPGDHAVYASGFHHGCVSATCTAALYRSGDGGTHWTALTARGYAGGRILVLPGRAAASTLLASGPQGVQRSDDGGSTFRTVVPIAGPAAILTAPASRTTLVIASQPLRLYDPGTGHISAGPSLPAGVVPLDVTAALDRRSIDIAVRLTAVASTEQGAGAGVVRCDLLANRCATVLVDGAAATFRFAAPAGGPSVAAFSQHRVYISTMGSPYTMIHDFGPAMVATMTLAPDGGSSVLVAALWSAGTHTGLVVTSADGGHHVRVRATGDTFRSAHSMAVVDGRILVATGQAGIVLASTDDGATWVAVQLPG